MSPERRQTEAGRLIEFIDTDPVVEDVARAAGNSAVYLVGGSVRDLLVGRTPSEIDFVVEGSVESIALALDQDATIHSEFGTAEVIVRGRPVDLAMARTETYPRPGSLPVVEPADLEADLRRRDFTVNAVAVPIRGAGAVIDPFDGIGDLERGVLRVLHPDSFGDDPTRALRAARYCSRLGLEPDQAMVESLRGVDLSTVSAERVARELDLIARDEDPAGALCLLDSWNVIPIGADVLENAADAFEAIRTPPWEGICSGEELVEALLSDDRLAEAARLVAEPPDAWEAFRAVRAAVPAVVVIARASGAIWLDRWPAEWRDLELGISGEDLLRKGIPEGPAVGSGLEAALRDRILNGDGGRERELAVALAEARGFDDA